MLTILKREIWRLKTRLFDSPYDQIQYKLRTFPSDVQTQVGTATGAGPLFSNLKRYVSYLPDLLETLDQIQNTTRSLDNQATYLNDKLDSLKSSFLGNFSTCHLEQCNNSKYIMVALELTANFTGQDLEPVKQDIEYILYGSENISFTMQQGEDEYDQIQAIVALVSNSTMWELKNELENYAENLYSYINETIDKIEEMDLSKARQDINETITKDVNDKGYYAHILFNAINTVALFIVTLLLVGLMFGCCGHRAGESATFCNRGNGASTLVVAIVTFFLLSWILMICTTAMFLGGGLSYTEICRHLILKESQDDLTVLDNMVTSYFNMSGASARTIMTNCENDRPFYQAFEVDKHYPDLNISKILDLSTFDFDGTIEELLSRNYSIGIVTMLNNGTKEHLKTIEEALQNTDTELYTNMAEQNITNYNLLNVSQLFDEYASELESSNPSTADLFRNYSQELVAVYNGIVGNMTTDMNKIYQMIKFTESYDAFMNLTVFISQMESTQDAVTSEEIRNGVNITANDIFDDIKKLANRIEYSVLNMIGRCYSVYNALTVTVSSVCVSFLYPFNAFWFSMGCFLFFCTLCIPVAFCLVTLYRKTVPHIPTHDLIGRPKLHRHRIRNQDADGVQSFFGSGRKHHQHDHQMEPSLMLSTPHGQRRYNHGFLPDDTDDHDDEGFIDYQRIQGSRQPPPRGNPIRPTQNYVIELRPTSYQQQYGDSGYEDYF